MSKSMVRFAALLAIVICCLRVEAQKDIYEITTYTLRSAAQVEQTDNYLKDSYMPLLHRMGIRQIGVFKLVANDTAAVKKILVIIPYISLNVWSNTKKNIASDDVFQESAKSFLQADTGRLPFVRIESTVLEAFPDHPKLVPASFSSDPNAVYELRSYESPTEHLHDLKVKMFNAGGEIKLFKSLGFEALFYGEVLSGTRMPNLMYMLAFTDLESKEAHWKAFGNSPKWKELSADPQYQNNISVNHIDSYLLRRAAYSEL